MRRRRPIFDLQEELLAPPELAAVDGAEHERIVQDSLRAARRTWELLLLRSGLWLANGGVLLASVWVVFELSRSGRPGPGAFLFFSMLPFIVYCRWRGCALESRLVRCALRDVLWRERIAPAACFDCGADLRAPEAPSGGRCRACGSALLRAGDDPVPELQGLNRPDPFHRGLEHATELRHLQREERRRLAEEARAAARRAPIVRTLNKLVLVVLILTMVLGVFGRGIVPWIWAVPAFPLLFFCAFGVMRAAILLEKRLAKKHLREGLFLSRLLPASCFRCHANLAGVTASRCPGCGALLLPESSVTGP